MNDDELYACTCIFMSHKWQYQLDILFFAYLGKEDFQLIDGSV